MAGSSPVDLCNDALGQVGATRITAIDEGSSNANWCLTFYEKVVRECLELTNWNFAKKRAILQKITTVPAFGFNYAYQLPVDYIRMVEYNGAIVPDPAMNPNDWPHYFGWYQIEEDKLLTNDGTAAILYISDSAETGKYTPLFVGLVTTLLASKLATAISKDDSLSDKLYARYYGPLRSVAVASNGQAGSVAQYVVDDLIWGR